MGISTIESRNKRQRLKIGTALAVIFFCMIGIIINIITQPQTYLFNIFALITIAILFFITILSHTKVMYIIQISVIIIVGILTIYGGEESRNVGDMMVLTGIVLSYAYGLSYRYSFKKIIIIILILTIYKGFASRGNLAEMVSMFISSTLVLLVSLLYKDKLEELIREMQKHESLSRIGLNAGNFLHNLHLATALKVINALERYITAKNQEKTQEYLEKLKVWIRKKVTMRNTIVTAISTNRTTKSSPVNIHDTITAVLETLYFDERVYSQIDIHTEFLPADLFINAVPFEIYFILQNVLMNAIDAMLSVAERRHSLIISSTVKTAKLIISIKDSGPGFPVTNGAIDLQSTKLTGGYGTMYIQTLMANYHGKVVFTNRSPYGAEVSLIFPKQTKIAIQFQPEEQPEAEGMVNAT